MPAVRAIAPWLGLVLLNAVFVLPGVAQRIAERPSVLLQPSGDLLVLMTLGIVVRAWGRWLWSLRLLAFAGGVLWVYLLDELIANLIVQQNPPLYDQLFLLRHLGVLVFDLWSWKVGLALLGGAVVLGLLVVLARSLVRSVSTALAAAPRRRTVAVGVALALFVGAGTAADFAQSRKRGNTWANWTTPALVGNLGASLRMYRSLQEGLDRSPYAGYERDVALTRKPDISLFLVESYGRMLIRDPEAGPLWRAQIAQVEQRLNDKGWYSVSAYSRAPISGGRSWLAEATLLTGVFVRFEAVFQHLVGDIHKTPNLVSFLDKQGYETVLLAPKDRPRPGIEKDVNRYRYDTQVLALDLEYTGPRFGWGIIPDQYTLGYATENVLAKFDAPTFVNFHMVSSHAPWEVIPPLVEDWRSLNNEKLDEETPEQRVAAPKAEFLARVRRYQRMKPQYSYMGDADALKIEAYAAAVWYDLELLTGHLEGVTDDSLVIIMGDHQPPLLSREDESFDVPIHILSRDPVLLEVFLENGFVEGMSLGIGGRTVLAHEGMFSLVVRALAHCCSGAQPPPYLPDGVRPGGPRTEAPGR